MDSRAWRAPGYAPGEAYAIMNNAGVREEYECIKDFVPKADVEIINSRHACNFLDEIEVEYLERTIKEIVDIMFSEGHFGNNPGDYPAHYYYEIKNMLEEVTGYKSNDHFSSLLRARELINNAADDIYRLPLEDMIKYCEDNLNNTPVSKDKSEEKPSQILDSTTKL